MNGLRSRKKYAYYALILFIGLVSVYDSMCVVAFRDDLVEENPVGQFLIQLADGEVYILVNAKTVLTIVSILICFRLVYTKYRVAIVGVFIFQLLLLFYLNGWEPTTEVYEIVRKQYQIKI